MDEYKKYLADRLLSDEQPITYRLLSRTLGIHVNTAKEMLFDYHTYQNGIKAESIHATYIVYGTKTDSTGDGDVEMSSSMPEHEPLSETVPTMTLSLVRQENLEAELADYQDVVSIHVYSLAPGPQRDVSLLYDVSKSVSEYTSKEDPFAACEKYGTIRNLNVRRRDRQARPKPGPSTSSQPAKPKPIAVVKSEPAAAAPAAAAPAAAAAKKPSPFEVAAAAAKLKKETSSQTPSSSETPASSAGKPAPSLKRGASGGIMQSFAKAAAKPPKPKPEPKKEDTEMALSDDGEADDEDIVPKKTEYKDSDAVRKSRKEREEELRRMMEEDDEDEKEKSEEDEPADEEMEEAPEPEPEPEEPKEKEKEPTEIITTTTNGRRRGRRQVMKKERVMDEQGYLVTVQKPGWESFSEDEAPPAKKPALASSVSSTPTSSAGKAKKPAAKGAQGNIMSFFAKKS